MCKIKELQPGHKVPRTNGPRVDKTGNKHARISFLDRDTSSYQYWYVYKVSNQYSIGLRSYISDMQCNGTTYKGDPTIIIIMRSANGGCGGSVVGAKRYRENAI